jgi:hypothetical protein
MVNKPIEKVGHEFGFTFLDYDDTLHFTARFFPEGRSAAEDAPWDPHGVPGRYTAVSAILRNGDVILDANSSWSDDARETEIQLAAHKSQIADRADAKCTIYLCTYKKLGTLRAGELLLGQDPDVAYAVPFESARSTAAHIVGQLVNFKLEGRKTKTLDEIEVTVFVKNTSDTGCFAVLCASHEANYEKGTLISPSAPDPITVSSQFVSPGETLKLHGKIYARHFRELEIEVPSLKDLAQLKLYPFVCIYGDEQRFSIELENPDEA